MFSTLVVILLEYLSDKIRSAEQMEQEFRFTNLGAISRWPNGQMATDGMVISREPHSIFAEMFRQVRANFQFSVAAHSGKAFVLARPGSGDGNTTLVANLGTALAQDGARVVVVDGDLRRPSLHERFNLPNTIGLSSLLQSDEERIEDILQLSSQDGVQVITSGPVPPNPAELLGSARMQNVIDALKERFDLVLFDSSPLGAVVDPVVLARKADGVVLMAVANGTRVREFRDGIKKVQHAGTPIIGFLLNKAPVRVTDGVYGYTSTNQARDGQA
jgi:capsular exopolysaccharide synthesis family protein